MFLRMNFVTGDNIRLFQPLLIFNVNIVENTITIKNGNSFEGIKVHIYNKDDYVGSIYIPSGATRIIGIGNDPYYYYSYGVGESKIRILFYSAKITIF